MSSSFLFSVAFSNINRNTTKKEILLYLVSFNAFRSQFIFAYWISRLPLVILSRDKEITSFSKFSAPNIAFLAFWLAKKLPTMSQYSEFYVIWKKVRQV